MTKFDVADAYTRLLIKETVYMRKSDMKKLDVYCAKIEDTKVINNYISDDHIGNGIYKVYI